MACFKVVIAKLLQIYMKNVYMAMNGKVEKLVFSYFVTLIALDARRGRSSVVFDAGLIGEIISKTFRQATFLIQ